MLAVIVAMLVLAACCLAGAYGVQAIAGDVPPPSRAKKCVVFALSFVGWPFVLVVLLCIVIVFWDLLWLSDPDDVIPEARSPRP